MNTRFTSLQKRLIAGAVLAYTLLYLDRLNLSAALPNLIAGFHIDAARSGLMPLCFSVSYACGQMLSGLLADRVRPVRMILTGLSGSLIVNLIMGLTCVFSVLPALCLVNGVFQSMLWTPIVKMVSVAFPEKEKQEKAHFLLSFTLVIGHFAGWGLSGLSGAYLGWRYSFILPAGINLLLLPLVMFLLRDAKQIGSTKAEKHASPSQSGKETGKLLLSTGFVWIVLASVFYGFVKDGIVTWTPELLSRSGSGVSAVISSLLLPALELIGILLGFFLRFRIKGGVRRIIFLMMPAAAIFCVPLFFVTSLPVKAVFLGFSCAVCFGVNPLLTSLVPMEYALFGCTGFTAGLCDCAVYIGSALAGAVGGTVSEVLCGNGLYLCWILAALLSAVMCLVSSRRRFDAALQDRFQNPSAF